MSDKSLNELKVEDMENLVVVSTHHIKLNVGEFLHCRSCIIQKLILKRNLNGG